MDASQKKAIVFDLDDTLAESKQAPDAEMAALLAALLSKKSVAVMSGGSFEQFQKQLLSALSLSPEQLQHFFLLPTSGASLYRFENNGWQKVYEERLTDDEATLIERELERAADECGAGAEETYGERIEHRGAQVTFSGLGQAAPVDAKRAWDPDKAKRSCMRETLVSSLSGFDIHLGGMTSVDVTKKGVNKAFGVRKLSELLGIPVAEMLYVGDALYEGGNDAVVKETAIDCVAVSGVEETKTLVRGIVATDA